MLHIGRTSISLPGGSHEQKPSGGSGGGSGGEPGSLCMHGARASARPPEAVSA